MKLSYTRAMIAAALRGDLDAVETTIHPVFKLEVPVGCEGVPNELWDVKGTWEDGAAYDVAAQELASRFADNFMQFEGAATAEMKAGAPLVTAVTQA